VSSRAWLACARYALAWSAALLLAGCDTTIQEQLGLRRSGPDEFQVIRREPLTMPPSMAELPVPNPGAPALSEATPSADARQVLLGNATVIGAGDTADGSMEAVEVPVTPGQQALLNETGEIPADPDIRRTLQAEEDDATSISTRTFLFIADWQRERPEDQPGVVLDPVAEARRLQEAGINASTRPLTTRVGSVPLAAPPVN
jgi:hypothetical protein